MDDWQFTVSLLALLIPIIIGAVIGAKWAARVKKENPNIYYKKLKNYIAVPTLIGMGIGAILMKICWAIL